MTELHPLEHTGSEALNGGHIQLQVPDTATNGTTSTPIEAPKRRGSITERRTSRDLHLRRKVMVCIDSSVYSKHMFEWAMDNVLRADVDHAILATAVDAQESSYISTNFARRNTAGTQNHARRLSVVEREEATEQLKPLIERLNEHNITGTVQVVKGDAKEQLVTLANDLKVDIMIVGCRGLSGFTRRLLGSVSDYCVHNCNCPVIVVKDQTLEKNMPEGVKTGRKSSFDLGRRKS